MSEARNMSSPNAVVRTTHFLTIPTETPMETETIWKYGRMYHNPASLSPVGLRQDTPILDKKARGACTPHLGIYANQILNLLLIPIAHL